MAPPHNSRPIPNLKAFVQILRRFKRSTVISVGIQTLLTHYNNPTARRDNKSRSQLINSYGPRIVMLALAAATEHRDKMASADDIHALCSDYLAIHDTNNFSRLLDEEAAAIHAALEADGNIPSQYINPDRIRDCCLELTMTRLLGSQYEDFLSGLQELLKAHRILELWEALEPPETPRPSEVCRTVFNIEAIHFFRSGFMLFALGLDERRGGHLTLRNLTTEEAVINNYQINPETCRLVASKISVNESTLREWYINMLDETPDFYQKFFSIPLHQTPLVHRNLGGAGREMEFLIPSPSLFVRGFVNAFYSQIFSYYGGTRRFGDAVEKYIYEALISIFGADKVSRIQNAVLHADFLIRHEECDLVLEIKSSLGGLEDHAMTPPSIQKLWNRLYAACTQCATSIHQHQRQDHPILGIIIVADHMTSQAIPFLSLAERTGMFNDLQVKGIEVFAWSYVEFVLSKTSIQKFIKALKKKWIEGTRQSAGDWVTFEMHDDDIPAHQHEYLEASHHAIFPGRAGERFPP